LTLGTGHPGREKPGLQKVKDPLYWKVCGKSGASTLPTRLMPRSVTLIQSRIDLSSMRSIGSRRTVQRWVGHSWAR
jgi:hypothetical protein